jgi:hypothetical protein
MSWHYSRALVEAYSEASSSDGTASAPLRSTPTLDEYSSHGRTTAVSRRSRSGTTSARLTDDHGEALLTWYREGSRVRTSAARAEGLASPDLNQVCGATWRASSVRFDPDTSGWRTLRDLFSEGSTLSSLILPRWGMMRDGALWEPVTPARRTKETASGSLLPTPTATANMMAPLMQKWRSHRNLWATPKARDWKGQSQRGIHASMDALPNMDRGDGKPVGGKLNPTWVEWLMGWPLGWTDCDASATVRFQQWLHWHGVC